MEDKHHHSKCPLLSAFFPPIYTEHDVPWSGISLGEKRGLLLKESASQGAPSERAASVPLWLPVVLSVREANCPWQRGRGREKAVKSRFEISLEL